MKLYLSGPMNRYPCFNFPAFFAAAEMLKGRGHEAINPAAHDLETYPDLPRWPGYATGDQSLCPSFDLKRELLWDLEQIANAAEGVVLLPGWQEKRCAKLEVMLAERLGLPVYLLETMERVRVRFDAVWRIAYE